MRISTFLTAAGLSLALAFAISVTPQAQAKTDEDYDKLMKAVGAANGAMRKANEAQQADAVAAEARKLTALFKEAGAFWTARKNTEAAEWSATALTHAAEIDKAATAKDLAGAMGHMKQLGGTCMTCHTKYRDKDATGFVMKKGV